MGSREIPQLRGLPPHLCSKNTGRGWVPNLGYNPDVVLGRTGGNRCGAKTMKENSRMVNFSSPSKPTNRRLLAVFAHPDDETAFSSILFRRIAQTGASLNLITLTNGEKSTLRFGIEEDVNLGEARKQEMQRIAQLFKVNHLFLPGFPDGEIENYSSEIHSYLGDKIEKLKPDVFVTMEQNGVSGHFDHIAVTRIVNNLQKSPEFKVIYTTVDENFSLSKKNSVILKNGGDVKPMLPTHFIKFTQEEIRFKMKSFLTHKTQYDLSSKDKLISFMAKWKKRRLLSNEFFAIHN